MHMFNKKHINHSLSKVEPVQQQAPADTVTAPPLSPVSLTDL